MLPVPSQTTIGTPYGAKCCGSTGRPHYWSLHTHKGVDYPAKTGTTVVAAWSGKVISANWGSAFGRHVVIDTDTLPDGTAGLWVGYMHLSSKSVSVGDRVKAGQKIGEVGSTGNVTGPHLHMEVQNSPSWNQSGFRDPKKWISAGAYVYFQGKKVYESKMVFGEKNSDSVRNVQIALNEKNNAALPTTGNYFDMTKAAVSKWQTKQGWSGSNADGIVGPSTAASLGLVWVAEEKPAPADPGVYVDMLKEALADIPRVEYTNGWDDPEIAGNGEFTPEYVMMHHTAADTGSLPWLRPGGAFSNVAAANFLVKPGGKIYVISAYKAYHAGKGDYADVPTDKMNNYSWGIEIENAGVAKDMPPEQIAAAAAVANALIKMMEAPITNIINHRTWSSTGKVDTLYRKSFWQNAAAGIGADIPVEEKWLSKEEADQLYLTPETANDTYAPVGDYLTNESAADLFAPQGDYLTNEDAIELYAPKGDYLTNEVASGLYAPLGEYMTKDVADALYAPNVAYLTKEIADTLYLTPSSLDSYLTKEKADSLYMAIDAMPECDCKDYQLPFIYKYTGKPRGTQAVGTKFVRVDDARWTPTKKGFLISMLYANARYELEDGVDSATIRVRAQREPFGNDGVDNTAYQDFTVTRDATVDGQFLITHVWFEFAQKGRPIHWEVDASAGFKSLDLSTRYSKWVLFPS